MYLEGLKGILLTLSDCKSPLNIVVEQVESSKT